MKLMNLTGHPLVLGDEAHRVRFPSRGRSRIDARYDVSGYVIVTDGDDEVTVPVITTDSGNVVSLPEPTEDVLYIVSGLVAGKVRRSDVMSPARLHKVNGRVEYARALMRYDP